MAEKTLEAHEYPLKDIFCDGYSFEIPQYQRPYSWKIEQAITLVDDLLQFLDEYPEDIRTIPPYFLGSIVLIKPDSGTAQIVDGQQRITTLTILFSVLRSLVPEKNKSTIENLIFQKGDEFLLTEDEARLKTRSRDQSFFLNYIQREKKVDEIKSYNNSKLNDSQKNMLDNFIAIEEKLSGESGSVLNKLCQLLLNKCIMVVVKTLDIDSAYRIFSVMNDRGLDLSATDILKSLITSAISESNGNQSFYTKKWEDIEEKLGREQFNALFSYIRMIELRTKSRSNLVSDFKKYIKPSEFPEKFIDESLEPYSEAYSDILSQNFNMNEKNNMYKSLLWLKEIDNNDWVPVAIYYLAKNRNNELNLSLFFSKLEILASILMINRIAVNYRMMRYKEILESIDNGSVFELGSPLELNNEDKDRAKYLLNGDLYNQSRIRKMVLLRLDYELSDGTAFYNMPIITVEHVMPQKVNEVSEWQVWSPDPNERKEWVHRLGNLVLLSRYKNSAASNYDFDKKKKIYFIKSGTSSPFVLTNQVIQESKWDLDVIKRRHLNLLSKLYDTWNLN
ncbi:DUF262 domain-containing HNH endonuclease family protein [Providencia vermicola]|uniref:DUF262 domain-containing protein n=1 Tax=Providencia vermicola TaxID=333965 RepID=UPI0032DBC711